MYIHRFGMCAIVLLAPLFLIAKRPVQGWDSSPNEKSQTEEPTPCELDETTPFQYEEEPPPPEGPLAPPPEVEAY